MKKFSELFSEDSNGLTDNSLDVEITVADRVGLDGISVQEAVINERGNLEMKLSDGTRLDAGRAMGTTGLTGIAVFDTVPEASPDPRMYLASGAGTYAHFKNRYGQSIHIGNDNSIVMLFSPAGSEVWEATEMDVDLTEYAKKDEPTYFCTEAPVFTYYPPSADPVTCYDEVTGKFSLADGQTTVTSQEAIYGKIVYTGCSHILMGFNMQWLLYLETATGKCLLMSTVNKETRYHTEPFAGNGTARKYIRVNNYNADSPVIDVEVSNDGYHYEHYFTAYRRAWEGLAIDFCSIGFYRPNPTDDPKILSIGGGRTGLCSTMWPWRRMNPGVNWRC